MHGKKLSIVSDFQYPSRNKLIWTVPYSDIVSNFPFWNRRKILVQGTI
jgi:hypothetical protein